MWYKTKSIYNKKIYAYGYEDAYNGKSGSYSKDTGDDRHIPIVMLAAFAYDDDLNEAINAGRSGFMTKPIQANTFKRENIAQHLTK